MRDGVEPRYVLREALGVLYYRADRWVLRRRIAGGLSMPSNHRAAGYSDG